MPGHGTVGEADTIRARIAQDREYVEALRDGRTPEDPRMGPTAPLEWLTDIHEWQAQELAGKSTSAATGT